MRLVISALVAFVFGAIASMSASAAAGQDSAVAESPPISAEIAADLKALADPEFNVRESAAQRLVARKLDAVAPLAHLAATGPLEASVRAFDVLRQLHRRGDDETNEAAELAFESLAGSENPGVASRAETALDASSPIRRVRAIAAFRKLGGIIRFQREDDAAKPADESSEMIEYAMVDKTSWTGGDDGLKFLRRIEDFRSQFEFRRAGIFVIKGSNVSEQAMLDLEASVPGLVVQRRGPACLGISAYSGFGGQQGLVISHVKAGTAADRAGLAPGDLVLKFAGHELPDFNTLVDRIGEKQPGDKVPVVYVRHGIERTVSVELKSWRDR
jgi:hypothetical protein